MSNQFFNNYNSPRQQALIESLVVESIKQYSVDVWYLPRTVINEDTIFTEPTTSNFSRALQTEMYIKEVNGFTGDGSFLSKFNIEIRDQLTLTVAIRTFREDVGRYVDFQRPQEGDLIWFPLNKKVFQIKNVPTEAVFYQMGALQMWDCICELFEWSNERFETGIPEIDEKYQAFSTDMESYNLLATNGDTLTDGDGFRLVLAEYTIEDVAPVVQNQELEVDASQIVDFSEKNPFGNY